MKESAIPVKLRDVELFKDLSEKELDLIRKCLKEKSYQKGEILFLEGNICERIFIVQSGNIKVFRTASSGKEQILETLSPGDTCACNPGSKEWHCSSSSQAMTDCKVWYFSREQYGLLVQSNPKIVYTLNKLFAERLCRFSSLIEEISLKDVKKRLIKFFLDMHANNVKKYAKSKVVFLPFTREEIAQRIGTSRETVARYLNQLKDEKLIDIKPYQIIIRDKEGLERYIR